MDLALGARFHLGAASGIDADIAIRPDADAVSDWATTAGGRRYSRTVQRGFTGLHVDGMFIDDPDDADRVWNETARLATQNKFTNAMENRVNDEHRTIRKVMQQVVHLEGFSACPKDAPEETPFGWRDWRTEKGETMHPRLSPGVLADKRLKLPGYNGQYNQNADELGSGMF